ncbi:MAG TPA: radical SAM family heme chaperone HemW [Oleiagrimonas sp.]|nr:radical SAM family heme chaperone HemW [Oleiagrimonas sp.]
MTASSTIPLALYVHMPWCVKKCPYCDFNSHGVRGEPPFAEYVDKLLADLDGDIADFGAALHARPIVSVFFGGGTPSLFAPEHIARFLDGARQRLPFADDCEITLETNPGTVEHGRFDGYLAAGVNRLSFGVQSFDDAKLRRLGRIHSAAEAEHAVHDARKAGYHNFNLDLMYALPEQTIDGALADVERAIALAPAHISHYQLTLEPNTAFHANPPPLPDDDNAWDMQEACQARLADAGYAQYEVSAYAKPDQRCRHNLNYWQFGDYLGIGAGAHGKLTDTDGRVHRRWKKRHPRTYLMATEHAARTDGTQVVDATQLPFEYMLNALRLIDGTAMAEFTARTGLGIEGIAPALTYAREHGWIEPDPIHLRTTPLGQRFLNDVISTFMA